MKFRLNKIFMVLLITIIVMSSSVSALKPSNQITQNSNQIIPNSKDTRFDSLSQELLKYNTADNLQKYQYLVDLYYPNSQLTVRVYVKDLNSKFYINYNKGLLFDDTDNQNLGTISLTEGQIRKILKLVDENNDFVHWGFWERIRLWLILYNV